MISLEGRTVQDRRCPFRIPTYPAPHRLHVAGLIYGLYGSNVNGWNAWTPKNGEERDVVAFITRTLISY